MTTEPLHSLGAAHPTAKRFVQRCGNDGWLPDREIKVLSFLVVANTTFINHIVVINDVCLTSFSLSEAVANRFCYRIDPVANSVDAAVFLSSNLVGILTLSKCHSGMIAQDLAVACGLQRVSHF